jgi:hypothetical protein
MEKKVIKKIFVTIDVDMTDYFSGNKLDEFDVTFTVISNILKNNNHLKTTWFIRIDNHIKTIYGNADYIFNKHRSKLDWLLDNGHELGWHHHAYKFFDNKWIQEIDENIISEQLKINAEIAYKYNLKTSRMGWGFHTNKTMKVLNDLGFKIDSSAIPRPIYNWELTTKDWTITPPFPYYPSLKDYRVSEINNLQIIEFPISTAFVKSKNDTEKIMRYINTAYYSNQFKNIIENNFVHEILCTIMHPYEIISNTAGHDLLAFSEFEFKKNIEYLANLNVEFKTISDFEF